MMGNTWLSSEEKEARACSVCKGTFDFWGTSRGFTLYRCRTCQLIHIVEMGTPASIAPDLPESVEFDRFPGPAAERTRPRREITLHKGTDHPVRVIIGKADRDKGELEEIRSISVNPEEDFDELGTRRETALYPGYRRYS